jgi:hypothetical protein
MIKPINFSDSPADLFKKLLTLIKAAGFRVISSDKDILSIDFESADTLWPGHEYNLMIEQDGAGSVLLVNYQGKLKFGSIRQMANDKRATNFFNEFISNLNKESNSQKSEESNKVRITEVSSHYTEQRKKSQSGQLLILLITVIVIFSIAVYVGKHANDNNAPIEVQIVK